MTDLLTRLTDARPTATELDAQWSPADRAARLDSLRAARRPATARPRAVRRTAWLAAAAAVAALVVVPTVVDSGDATAADLHALARSAVRYDGPVLAEGRWLHERSTSLQRNSRILSDGDVYDNERETWTAWDGTIYAVEHRPSAGWTSYDVLTEKFTPSYGDPTPQFAATLPDDAAGLRSYLDPLVSGSNSHDEALFSALTGLATSHTLPPRTLAAAFEALADVDGVDTDQVTVDGRPAVAITFTQHYLDALGTSSIVADRATGQVLSASELNPMSDYRSSTSLSEVVDEVPADVLVDFATYGDGGIDCPEGGVACRN